MVRAGLYTGVDVVVVWRLDRWGRLVTDLLATLQKLEHLGQAQKFELIGPTFMVASGNMRIHVRLIILVSNAFSASPVKRA